MSKYDDRIQASVKRSKKSAKVNAKKVGQGIGIGFMGVLGAMAAAGEVLAEAQRTPWTHKDEPKRCSMDTHLYDCEDRDCFWHRSDKERWYQRHGR